MQTILQLAFDVWEVNTRVTGTIPPPGPRCTVSPGVAWLWARVGGPEGGLPPARLQSRKHAAGEHRAPTTFPHPAPGAAGAGLQAGEDNSGPACAGERPYGEGGGCPRGAGGDNNRALGSLPRSGAAATTARRPPGPRRRGRAAGARCRVTHGSRHRIRPRPSQAGRASRVRAQAGKAAGACTEAWGAGAAFLPLAI